ncbi:hypothetical protein TetV_498 [Tetraselmis virus 1]|uniref:Uncharacterized protein n=1 Tax=Tetraselmis virus 1 TaxID=2060617 RepID=A0A2P0VNY7_9VIRU|nr:hypothetical protein QJ968_gp556 [Tetraselmis virus 1]AUF82580.1 hypothetical protein TetV_498 [Tetraselmis virus 1]
MSLPTTISVILPQGSSRPTQGKTDNLLIDDDTTCLWDTSDDRPFVMKYIFHKAVDITGYTVAPPPEEPRTCINGWQIEYYEHGVSSDGWNLIKRTHISKNDWIAGNYNFAENATNVGLAVITFGSTQRFEPVGFSKFYFEGSVI